MSQAIRFWNIEGNLCSVERHYGVQHAPDISTFGECALLINTSSFGLNIKHLNIVYWKINNTQRAYTQLLFASLFQRWFPVPADRQCQTNYRITGIFCGCLIFAEFCGSIEIAEIKNRKIFQSRWNRIRSDCSVAYIPMPVRYSCWFICIIRNTHLYIIMYAWICDCHLNGTRYLRLNQCCYCRLYKYSMATILVRF